MTTDHREGEKHAPSFSPPPIEWACAHAQGVADADPATRSPVRPDPSNEPHSAPPPPARPPVVRLRPRRRRPAQRPPFQRNPARAIHYNTV